MKKPPSYLITAIGSYLLLAIGFGLLIPEHKTFFISTGLIIPGFIGLVIAWVNFLEAPIRR